MPPAEPPSKMGYQAGLGPDARQCAEDDAWSSRPTTSPWRSAKTSAARRQAFAARMNAEAQRLGMTGSHFVNPNGLHDDDQYTTARDLALLVTALRTRVPAICAAISRSRAWRPARRRCRATTLLIGRFDGADGMKTGFICPSGFNLVGSATRNGRTLMAVVLGANSVASRAEEAAACSTRASRRPAAGRDARRRCRPMATGRDTADRHARRDLRQEEARPTQVRGSSQGRRRRRQGRRRSRPICKSSTSPQARRGRARRRHRPGAAGRRCGDRRRPGRTCRRADPDAAAATMPPPTGASAAVGRQRRQAAKPAKAAQAGRLTMAEFPDPGLGADRLSRRRQDDAAQPAAQGPGARRHRRHHQRVRRCRDRPSAGRAVVRRRHPAFRRLPLLHGARRTRRHAGRSGRPAADRPHRAAEARRHRDHRASPIRRRCCSRSWRIRRWSRPSGSTA